MGDSGGNWLATTSDLVRFLTALDGSRGRAFFPPRLYQEMLAAPPPPLEVHKNGTHVGLGWDTVRLVDGGVRFSKNGGRAGIMAWLEHLPDGVDWALCYNTSAEKTDDGPKPVTDTRQRVYKAIDDIKNWPAIDLWRN